MEGYIFSGHWHRLLSNDGPLPKPLNAPKAMATRLPTSQPSEHVSLPHPPKDDQAGTQMATPNHQNEIPKRIELG